MYADRCPGELGVVARRGAGTDGALMLAMDIREEHSKSTQNKEHSQNIAQNHACIPKQQQQNTQNESYIRINKESAK